MNRQKIFLPGFGKNVRRLLAYFSVALILAGCAAVAPAVETVVVGSATRMTVARAVTASAFTGSRVAPAVAAAIGVNALGEAVITNPAAANELFGKMSLRYTKGSSPKVYYEGSSEPLFEIHTRSRQLRNFKTGELHPIPNNVFSVTSEGAEVRQGSLMSARVIDRVYKRDIVIKLAEENGWYRIRLARDSKPIEGWVKAEHLIALALLGDENDVPAYKYPSQQNQTQQAEHTKPKIHDCEEMRTGDLKFVNKTNSRIVVTIYDAKMQQAYVGYTKQLTLAPNEEKSFYDLPIGIYKYEAKEDAPVRVRTLQEIQGETRVVMCKTTSCDLR